MKTRPTFYLAALIAALMLHDQTANVFAQGSLTPTGAPAPTMKTLDQIEPRTPISSVPVTITQSGSYYLTTNLSAGAGFGGITIAFGANNVTVDLNGFTLSGSATNSAAGIFVLSGRVRIRNGMITGWGAEGIDAVSASGYVFEDLLVAGNGRGASAASGMRAGNDTQIIRCTVVSNSAVGILVGAHSKIESCIATANGDNGIQAGNQCVLERCTSDYNTLSGFEVAQDSVLTRCAAAYNGFIGINANNNCRLADCVANSNTNVGVAIQSGSSASGCVAAGNHVGGLAAYGNDLISHCSASGNTGSGISAQGPGVTIMNCNSDNNTQDGILVNSGGCSVIGNLLRSNDTANVTGNFRITAAGNRIEGNHIAYTFGFAIQSSVTAATNNVIIRNTTSGNTNNIFSIGAANDVGPWSKAATATSPWANIFNY